MWDPKLYRGVVWEDNPKLFNFGMQLDTAASVACVNRDSCC